MINEKEEMTIFCIFNYSTYLKLVAELQFFDYSVLLLLRFAVPTRLGALTCRFLDLNIQCFQSAHASISCCMSSSYPILYRFSGAKIKTTATTTTA